MPEQPPSYSDPEDKVDYQVIKSSYGRVNRASTRSNLYAFVIFLVIILLCMMVFFQSLKIASLERKITDLETKVINLESQLQR